jgi:hypothetical protein
LDLELAGAGVMSARPAKKKRVGLYLRQTIFLDAVTVRLRHRSRQRHDPQRSEDLQRLVRQREKVLKSAAKQRSAELLADFENQMGSEYAFDQDAIWQKAMETAEREVKKAQVQVATRCRELGIPDRVCAKPLVALAS